ncbi:hypothetical protein L7F22_035671 [Adiantum nelumboides]|nr:hypothetical protein [Adiantum nelumboides]
MDVPSMEADFKLDAFSELVAKYPAYKDTMIIDSLQCEEYPHLEKKGQACLDYTGVGLFLGSQVGQFGLELSHAIKPSNTCQVCRRWKHKNHAFFAFELLGTTYPFHEAPNLLLAYDHKCENVGALSDCCLAKSADCVHSVALSWPWCRVNAHDLEKKLHCKEKVCMHK